MNDEEKAAEIKALSAEVESIIKYSHLPARNGEKAKTFTNAGAASSAARARCRKILELKGASSHTIKTASNSTTAMMKLAGIDLNKKKPEGKDADE